jgi:hypothetical protein
MAWWQTGFFVITSSHFFIRILLQSCDVYFAAFIASSQLKTVRLELQQ